MPLDLQSVINSRIGVGLALGLGRIVPTSVGYRWADWLAMLISTQKEASMYRAVRANQWVIHGGDLSLHELDQAVKAVFRNTAYCLYDFYHHMDRYSEIEKRIRFRPEIEALLDHRGEGDSGTVIVVLHLSNFDLVAREAARRGLKGMILAYPNPGKGYQWQNALRRRSGLDLVPTSTKAIRHAIRRLKQGENVLTGIDRPIQNVKYRPTFFGRPANLPVHHIHLALAATAPVIVVAAINRPGGIYDILVSEAIRMQTCSDRDKEILLNAEKVLTVAEGMIHQAPEQWSMFFPVWPRIQKKLDKNLKL
jgi:lauroyl/myristoyl acyltransferase